MFAPFRPALTLVALFTLATGVVYPLAVTGLAALAFPFQAEGSLIKDGRGEVLGSTLIAQGFSGPGYLHPRGSAAGSGWDGAASGASNLGPMDPALISRVGADAARLARENPGAALPADAVTWSASGLDPDISPANAAFQAPRVAKARGLSLAQVERIIAAKTSSPELGFLGQSRVNVLAANLALARLGPARADAVSGS